MTIDQILSTSTLFSKISALFQENPKKLYTLHDILQELRKKKVDITVRAIGGYIHSHVSSIKVEDGKSYYGKKETIEKCATLSAKVDKKFSIKIRII